MNKMGRGEYEYINGNTVVSPSREVEKQHIRKKKESQRVRRNRRLKENRKSDRRYVRNVAVIILCFGSLTILGDSRVYNLQRQVRDLNTQIDSFGEDNEALRITILKYSSLKNIQDSAQSQLAMQAAQKEDVVKVDCRDNYFKNIQSGQDMKNDEKVTLLDKVKNIFK